MFNDQFNLDLSTVKESTFELLPPGWHFGSVQSVELKTTKSGTGQYVKVAFKVKDKVIFHNFNIRNDNPKAMQIGLGELKKFATASGVPADGKIASLDTIRAFSCMLNIAVKEDEGYGAQNVVKGFKPASAEAIQNTDKPRF